MGEGFVKSESFQVILDQDQEAVEFDPAGVIA